MSDICHIHCDCGAVSAQMTGDPKVRAFCHCEDCRELLQVPYHSVLAWDGDQVRISKGEAVVFAFQHPHKRMKRFHCMHCGDVLFNTNAMGWKIVSQLMYRKSNDGHLPQALQSNAHFFYDRRVVDVNDALPKR